MLDEKPQVGAALDRSIAPGEETEQELDRFIARRHDQRVREEGERNAEEEAWRQLLARYHRAEREQLAACEEERRLLEK